MKKMPEFFLAPRTKYESFLNFAEDIAIEQSTVFKAGNNAREMIMNSFHKYCILVKSVHIFHKT